MRTSFCAIVLVVASATSAFAGKGAFLRIFNLTDHPAKCEARVLSFDSGLEGQLTGTIPARGAFPKAGPVYLEESAWYYADELRLKFDVQYSTPKLTIEYWLGYKVKDYRPSEDFKLKTIIQRGDSGGTQDVISIFITRTDVESSEWMAHLDDDTWLEDMLIPGTRYSAAIQLPDRPGFQTLSISDQLREGVRFIDLRGYDADALRARISYGQYGMFQQRFEDVVRDIVQFLKARPSETVLLSVSMDAGGGPDANALLRRLAAQSEFRDYFYDSGFRFRGTKRLPPLGDARGSIVLINRFSSALLGPVFAYDIAALYPQNGMVTTSAIAVQDRDRNISIDEKKRAVESFFRSQMVGESRRLRINSLGGSIDLYRLADFAKGTSGANADGLNLFTGRVLLGRPPSGRCGGVFAIDLIEKNDPLVRAIYFQNFEERQPIDFRDPEEGQLYSVRLSTDPNLALEAPPSINGVDDRASVVRARNARQFRPTQHFYFDPVPGRNNYYRIRSSDAGGSPQYLSVLGRLQDIVVMQPASKRVRLGDSDNQMWRILRHDPGLQAAYGAVLSPAINEWRALVSYGETNDAGTRDKRDVRTRQAGWWIQPVDFATR